MLFWATRLWRGLLYNFFGTNTDIKNAIEKELKDVRMPFNLEVGEIWMDAEKEMKTQRASWHCKLNPDGP